MPKQSKELQKQNIMKFLKYFEWLHLYTLQSNERLNKNK